MNIRRRRTRNLRNRIFWMAVWLWILMWLAIIVIILTRA